MLRQRACNHNFEGGMKSCISAARLAARWAGLFGCLFLAAPAAGQAAYIDQDAVAALLNRRAASLDDIPDVAYEYHVLGDERGNQVLARNSFYKVIGDGDAHRGKERSELVQMLNRRLMRTAFIGDTLVAPTRFDLDFRAYSPFPHYYPGGSQMDKLFIMDKSLQAFAAYELGELMRWGIINTGDPNEVPTPNGRFNFTWKEPYRVSDHDSSWVMHWVFNFYLERGMHVHQYEMPTGGPMSNGCVRLVDADAEWVYEWADPWQTTAGTTDKSSAEGLLIRPGTTVLILGTEPEDKPDPFIRTESRPVLKRVQLPKHPYDIPPGSPQQVWLDRLRQGEQAETDAASNR